MHRRTDAGMGLVEVVVVMLLFAIFSLAFLPVLIQGLRVSADNTTRSAGVQRMQEAIEKARAAASCTAIANMASDQTFADARNVEIEVVVAPVGIDDCPTEYPSTVPFSVVVIRTDTDVVLAQSDTLIYVTSE